MFSLILVVVLALAAVQAEKPAAYGDKPYTSDYRAPLKYNFTYVVNDYYGNEEQSRTEAHDSSGVRGEYHVNYPYGSWQSVHYEPDHGYQYAAKAEYEPAAYAPKYEPAPYQPKYEPVAYAPKYEPPAYTPKYEPAPYKPKYEPAAYAPKYEPAPYKPKYEPAPYKPKYEPAPYKPKYEPAPYKAPEYKKPAPYYPKY